MRSGSVESGGNGEGGGAGGGESLGSGDTAEALGGDWGGVSSEWFEPDNAGFPSLPGEGELESVSGPKVGGWDCGTR